MRTGGSVSRSSAASAWPTGTTSNPRSTAGSTSRWRNRSRKSWWWPYSSPSVATTTRGEPACQLDELSRWSGLEVRGRTHSRAKRSASAVTSGWNETAPERAAS